MFILMDKLKGHVIVFDFDGVLAWNLQLYTGVIEALQTLHRSGALICLASFNYSAIDILKMYGLDYIFSAWRCGRSDVSQIKHSLESEEGDHYIKTNSVFTKETQIVSMISELFSKNKIPEQEFPSIFTYPKVIFFDDNPDNIIETMKSYEINCWAVNVNPSYGIPKNILNAIEYIIDYWNTNPILDHCKCVQINQSLNELLNK